MRPLAQLIATVLGVGYVRPAPGTWGSLIALPWAWLLHVLGGFPLLVIGVLVAFLKGWWATAVLTRGAADHDPSEIVVDELVGQWIALLPLSYAAWAHQIDKFFSPYETVKLPYSFGDHLAPNKNIDFVTMTTMINTLKHLRT